MSFVLHGPDPSVFDTSNRQPHVIIIGAGLAGEEPDHIGILLKER
jgi:hypothetical protein